MIGMDISPMFQGRKLSKPFYRLFFEFLKLNNFSKASLKVFSKNHIAHNLYMDLGFVEISRGFIQEKMEKLLKRFSWKKDYEQENIFGYWRLWFYWKSLH